MGKSKQTFEVSLIENAFNEENQSFAEIIRGITGSEKPRVALIADQNVVQRIEGLGSQIGRYFAKYGIELAASPTVICGGERLKSDYCYSIPKIANELIHAKVGANDVVVVIGGGALIDVSGYVLTQLRGGMKVVRMPTTVCSMVGSSFAETVAINQSFLKNGLRIKSSPVAVVIDPSFAKSITDGTWRGGFAEFVKIAAVNDAALMKKLAKCAADYERRDFEVFKEILAEALDVRRKKPDNGFAQWSYLRISGMTSCKMPHACALTAAILIDTVYSSLKGYIDEKDRALIFKALEESGASGGLFDHLRLVEDKSIIIAGLDALNLANGSPAIVVPGGIGKSKIEEDPDREVMNKAIEYAFSLVE